MATVTVITPPVIGPVIGGTEKVPLVVISYAPAPVPAVASTSLTGAVTKSPPLASVKAVGSEQLENGVQSTITGVVVASSRSLVGGVAPVPKVIIVALAVTFQPTPVPRPSVTLVAKVKGIVWVDPVAEIALPLFTTGFVVLADNAPAEITILPPTPEPDVHAAPIVHKVVVAALAVPAVIPIAPMVMVPISRTLKQRLRKPLLRTCIG